MIKIKSTCVTVAIAILLFVFASCNNKQTTSADDNNAKADRSQSDTLSDALQFTIELEGKKITIDSSHIRTAYNRHDSLIDITARWGDTAYIVMTIPQMKETPFDVFTGYRAARNKAFDSDEWIPYPTITLYNHPKLNISFNNLNDGNAAGELKPGAIHISSLRELPGGNNSDGWTYLVKGTFNTVLLKNVYNGGDKPYNHNYPVKGSFVVKLNTGF